MNNYDANVHRSPADDKRKRKSSPRSQRSEVGKQKAESGDQRAVKGIDELISIVCASSNPGGGGDALLRE